MIAKGYMSHRLTGKNEDDSVIRIGRILFTLQTKAYYFICYQFVIIASSMFFNLQST